MSELKVVVVDSNNNSSNAIPDVVCISSISYLRSCSLF